SRCSSAKPRARSCTSRRRRSGVRRARSWTISKRASPRAAKPPEAVVAAEPQAAAEARAFWSGTITFGLVSVPVDLYPAVRSQRVSLRMLGPEVQPPGRRYVCAADGETLTDDDIVRGYEWEDGSYTVVDDVELDALAPEKSRDIDLRRFVAREEIPADLLVRTYVLAPSGESTKA